MIEKSQQSVNGPNESENRVQEAQKIDLHPDQEPTTVASSLGPYTPEELWIDLSKVHAAAAVVKPVTTILLRPPNKHEFFMVHPGEAYWKPVALIELEKIIYLVHPKMVCHLDADDLTYAYLVLCISKSGQLFFWPIKISSKGKNNAWNESALEIAKMGSGRWVKKRSRQEDGRGGGYYEAEYPIIDFGKPAWPEIVETPKRVYDVAFKGDRIIDRVDHMVVLKLTGQIK